MLQIVQQVNSFLFNFFLEFGTPDRIRTYNLWCRRPLLIQLSFKRIKSLVVRAGLEPATTRLSKLDNKGRTGYNGATSRIRTCET